MAVLDTPTTLSRSDVVKPWRKVQGKVATGFQFMSEEYQFFEDLLDKEGMPWSARENTFPIDLNEGYGVASIPEFGYEASPSSPDMAEATVDIVHFNKRFNISKLAKYGDKDGAQLIKQLKYQGKKALEALAAHFSDYFYGTSTGVLALTNTDLNGSGSHELTLIDAYGIAAQDDPVYLTHFFKIGDRIAVLVAGVFITGAIGPITAINATTGTITFTPASSISSETTNGLQIVKANSMENATLAGTDYNKGLVGLVDYTRSAALHGLTHANWVAAYSSSTAGSFTGLKYRRAINEIHNYGGGKPDVVFLSQGVERDLIRQERTSLRWDSPMGMEIDGSVKAKGAKFYSSRRMLQSEVIVMDSSAGKRWALLPKPDGAPMWSDAKEYIDLSGFVLSIDLPIGMVWNNRKKVAYFTAQTES